MKQSLSVIFNASDASVDHNSSPLFAQNLIYASLQGVVTGASTGAIKLQFSNDIVDPVLGVPTITNWSDIPNANATLSTSGVFSIPVTQICAGWIRVVYSKNNGSAGTISANIKVQGV